MTWLHSTFWEKVERALHSFPSIYSSGEWRTQQKRKAAKKVALHGTSCGLRRQKIMLETWATHTKQFVSWRVASVSRAVQCVMWCVCEWHGVPGIFEWSKKRTETKIKGSLPALTSHTCHFMTWDVPYKSAHQKKKQDEASTLNDETALIRPYQNDYFSATTCHTEHCLAYGTSQNTAIKKLMQKLSSFPGSQPEKILLMITNYKTCISTVQKTRMWWTASHFSCGRNCTLKIVSIIGSSFFARQVAC